MTTRHSNRDTALFLGQLLRRPWRIVALAPSSTGLANLMAETLDPDTGGVIELGAGTGKISEAILARGIPQDRLAMIEMNEEFVKRLKERFPQAQVLNWTAQQTADVPLGDVGAVVSGLPLLSMPIAWQRDIIGGAFAKLRPGGSYIQFTYGGKPPIAREVQREMGLTWEKTGKVWWNLPPASVYIFKKPD